MMETFKGYPWNVLDAMESPPTLWLGPAVSSELEDDLRARLAEGAQIFPIFSGPNFDASDKVGPAVPVLSAEDLGGPRADELLDIVARALPGRPVIYGGAGSRDILLDAINRWGAFRLLPEGSPVQAMVVAIHKAHEVLCLEGALTAGAEELRQECRRLDGAISELKVTQERLLHAERLAMVGRTSGTLMARVDAHFHCLDTLSSALRTLEKDPRLLGLLETTMEGARSVNTLLEDLVAITENREQEVAAREELLDPLVERAVAFLRHDAALRKREVALDVSSGARVVTDRHRIYLVLMNLLRNAVHATEPGDAIRVRALAQGEEAIIEVEDEGCGMAPEVRDQIFDPFFTTKGEDGMGLGLRLCKSSIERLGGKLECESVESEGTVFRIRMPIKKS
jgi:signal transduction histidine kinase